MVQVLRVDLEARRIEFGLIEKPFRSKSNHGIGKTSPEPYRAETSSVPGNGDPLMSGRIKPQHSKRRGLKAKIAAARTSRTGAANAGKKAGAKHAARKRNSK
jgi:hypothetical protein